MALVAASAATISFDLHVSLSLSCTPRSEIAVYLPPPHQTRLAHTHSVVISSLSHTHHTGRGVCAGGETCTTADQITWPLATPSHTGGRPQVSHHNHGYIVIWRQGSRPQTVALVVIRRATSFPQHIAKITELPFFVRVGWLHLHTSVLLRNASRYWSYTRKWQHL